MRRSSSAKRASRVSAVGALSASFLSPTEWANAHLQQPITLWVECGEGKAITCPEKSDALVDASQKLLEYS